LWLSRKKKEEKEKKRPQAVALAQRNVLTSAGTEQTTVNAITAPTSKSAEKVFLVTKKKPREAEISV
jgi:hypothetical protein